MDRLTNLINDFNNIGVADVMSNTNIIISCIVIALVLFLIIISFINGPKKQFETYFVSFFCIPLILGFPLYIILSNIYIEEEKKLRLEEIIEVAQEENIKELQITENGIIYNDAACNHGLEDIDSLVGINNEGYLIYLKD